MAQLGDFLGTLLAEFTVGRAQADLRALDLARSLYQRDELLRTFPVPRFRLPAMVVRVPMAVRKAPDPWDTDGSIRGAVSSQDQMTAATISAVAGAVKDSNARLTPAERDAVRSAIDDATKSATADAGAKPLHLLAATLATSIVPRLQPLLKQDPRTLEKDLSFRILAELVHLGGTFPRLDVGITAAELRDAGQVMTLELTVREEALEWTLIESDGQSRDRLVPE